MNKLPASSPIVTDDRIYPKICPICGVQTNNVYRVEDVKKQISNWYNCGCGVTFQGDPPQHGGYNTEYSERYTIDKNKSSVIHAGRVYAPIIEELTYGRKMLDVGFASAHNMNFFDRRGWLVWGIDVNEDLPYGGNLHKGDFTTYDFSPNISSEQLSEEIGRDVDVSQKFDLIWMSHVFEHFDNPIAAIRKSYNLLDETGVLYISTPDIEFVNKTGVTGFPHFIKDEHNIMWTERALKRELEREGFKVVMSRRNYSSRYISWFDIQIIAQKNYF